MVPFSNGYRFRPFFRPKCYPLAKGYYFPPFLFCSKTVTPALAKWYYGRGGPQNISFLIGTKIVYKKGYSVWIEMSATEGRGVGTTVPSQQRFTILGERYRSLPRMGLDYSHLSVVRILTTDKLRKGNTEGELKNVSTVVSFLKFSQHRHKKSLVFGVSTVID